MITLIFLFSFVFLLITFLMNLSAPWLCSFVVFQEDISWESDLETFALH
jgi:hypothetical protein